VSRSFKEDDFWLMGWSHGSGGKVEKGGSKEKIDG
jgi:hypothetical protein